MTFSPEKEREYRQQLTEVVASMHAAIEQGDNEELESHFDYFMDDLYRIELLVKAIPKGHDFTTD